MPEPVFSDNTPDHLTEEHQTSGRGTIRLLVIMAVGAVAILAAIALKSQNPALPTDATADHPAVGTRLRVVKLEPLVGISNPLSLEEMQGKVSLINFWGTWCGPCRIELPELVKINDELAHEEDFLFVSISCGQGPDREIDWLKEETQAFMARQQYSFPVYADQNAITRFALIDHANMPDFGYPTTLIVDGEGIIRGVWQGYAYGSEAEMRAKLEALLGS